MNIYKAEIIKYCGFNQYSYSVEKHIEETGFFSTMEKANEYLLNKGFMFSPVLILCGDKVVRVCKDRDEANSLLMPSSTNQEILDLFHINSAAYEYRWILPSSIVNENFDCCSPVTYANIEEIEVM